MLTTMASLLAGCGSSGSQHAILPPGPPVASVIAPSTTTSTIPSRTNVVAEGVSSAVAIYSAPRASRPIVVLPNPWLLNGAPNQPIPQAFLVLGFGAGGWVHVLLPERPNGTSGWLAPGSVKLLDDPYRIQVVLHQHQIKIMSGDSQIYSGPVATGAPATPTPTGLYFIRVLLRTVDPSSVYGPFAYGLSAHSEALTTFDGGDAEIGIHGNNDVSVLGRSVTHGCVRMDNAEITKLSAVLPLGTPVEIDP